MCCKLMLRIRPMLTMRPALSLMSVRSVSHTPRIRRVFHHGLQVFHNSYRVGSLSDTCRKRMDSFLFLLKAGKECKVT